MIEVKEVTSINGLANDLINMDGPWVYRGQRDYTWLLEPNITRAIPSGAGHSDIHKIEKSLRQYFASSAMHFAAQGDLPKTDLGWLSLMQHYSAPTRLLDFTESPFMALFFAFDGVVPSAGGRSVITAINYRELNKRSLEITRQKVMDVDYDYVKFNQNQDTFFTEHIYKHSLETLWVLDPSSKNQRLMHQKGCFLVKGNITVPTIEIIDKNYSEVPMMQYIINHDMITDVFDVLAKCGISYHGVYPGLEGLGRDVMLSLLQNSRKAQARA